MSKSKWNGADRMEEREVYWTRVTTNLRLAVRLLRDERHEMIRKLRDIMAKQVNLGGRLERRAVYAKLRSDARHFRLDSDVRQYIHDLMEWMLTRRKRYGKKPGGLGR